LDYAAFESKVLRNFEKAERILRHQILDYQLEDKEALLALGDNNLEWGELDPSRYEEARKAFARLMGRYGSEDQYLERMLLYFIRTDSLAETLPLQAHFLSSKRRKISSATLSELGGYFLDKKTAVTEGVPDRNLSRIENIKELLQEAVRRDAKNPEAYYHLTRYFERFGKPAEEKRAAERAIEAFAAAPESSAKRASYRIDAHRRLASLLVKEKEFLSAEERLLEGIRLYEDALARRLLGRKQEFGRLYADLGDIEYFKAGDLDAAVDNYQEAERNAGRPLKYATASATRPTPGKTGAMRWNRSSRRPRNPRSTAGYCSPSVILSTAGETCTPPKGITTGCSICWRPSGHASLCSFPTSGRTTRIWRNVS
jgi:tetratricopeptide (TPR) repeat protein